MQEGDMDRSQSRTRWNLWTLGLAACVAVAGMQPAGQAPVGASGRPPAQREPDLMVMSPKAKSSGWTGVHRPHTKLRDVLARHQGQADWTETIVDDESLFTQWM